MLIPLAAVIRSRRLEKNLSANRFARLLKVTPEIISEIEQGEADLDIGTLFDIANHLEISCGDLALQAQLLSNASQITQYRLARKQTSLKQMATLQRQNRKLTAQIDVIEHQRRVLIGSANPDDATHVWPAQKKEHLQVLAARLNFVERHQEERERFLLRFLASRVPPTIPF